MKDKVIINDLCVETIVGLYPWERVARQSLLINVELACDIAKVAKTENLADAIDYSAVCQSIIELTQEGEFTLIEILAERISVLAIETYGAQWVKVGVFKQDVLTQVSRVGVEIERSNNLSADQ